MCCHPGACPRSDASLSSRTILGEAGAGPAVSLSYSPGGWTSCQAPSKPCPLASRSSRRPSQLNVCFLFIVEGSEAQGRPGTHSGFLVGEVATKPGCLLGPQPGPGGFGRLGEETRDGTCSQPWGQQGMVQTPRQEGQVGLGLQGLDKLGEPTDDISAVSKLSSSRSFKKRGEREGTGEGRRRGGGGREGGGEGKEGTGERKRYRHRVGLPNGISEATAGVPSAGRVRPKVCTGETLGAWVPSIPHPTQASL